jgi:hypothetical protein
MHHIIAEIAERLGLSGPVAEQCQHHMFHRDRPEKEYASVILICGYMLEKLLICYHQ